MHSCYHLVAIVYVNIHVTNKLVVGIGYGLAVIVSVFDGCLGEIDGEGGGALYDGNSEPSASEGESTNLRYTVGVCHIVTVSRAACLYSFYVHYRLRHSHFAQNELRAEGNVIQVIGGGAVSSAG